MSVEKRYLKRDLLGDNETSLGLRGDRPYANDGGSDAGLWDRLMNFLTGSEQKTVKKLLAKQNAEGAEKNKGILSEWEREGEWQDNDYYSGLLASEEFESDDNENIAEELSYSLEPEDQWVQRHVDAENKGKDLAREEHLLRRGSEDTSGGMTNNAFASKSSASKMSPQAKTAMIGLLKDFLTPAPDDPPTQVRSAGISRGSTPFPSLLQKRPERKYYQNKGLG
jgi:hypothetical protein